MSERGGRRSVEDVLRQAPVDPVHDDGVRPFAIGTVLIAIGALVLLIFGNAWAIADWWFHVAYSGFGIGVVGTAYCLWRRKKRRADAALGIAPPTA